jgi:hypothetical protein
MPEIRDAQHSQDPHAAEERLPGGNVGGAVRVGDTVRRPTGPWTPAVHALLGHLAEQQVRHLPRVHGFDDQGREVLDYLPGEQVDLTAAPLGLARLESLVRWTRGFHRAVASFAHLGPWRFWPTGGPTTLIAHNDLGAYNLCFARDELSGVFDWDLAGPSTPLLELAFIAWNGVPLWSADVSPGDAAERLHLIADTYGGVDPRELLHAVPWRIQLMIDGIREAAAQGDPGMANLVRLGEQGKATASRARLVDRIPLIDRLLDPH